MAQPIFRSASAVFSVPSSGNGTVQVDAPAGLADGDYVFLVCVTPSSGAGAATAGPDAGLGFGAALAFNDNGTFSGGMRVYGKLAASEPASYGVSESVNSNQGNAFTFAYSTVGATPMGATPVVSGGQASSITPFIPAIVAGVDGKLIGITFEWNGRSVAITPAGSMSTRTQRAIAPSFVVSDENVVAGAVAQRNGSAASGDYRGISIILAGTTVAVPPAVTGNPSAQAVTIPAVATFGGTFSGTATSVQWKRKVGGVGAAVDVVGGSGATTLGVGTVGYTTAATAASGGNHNDTDTYGFVLQPGSVESTYAALTATAGTVPVAFTGSVPAQTGVAGVASTALALAGYFAGTQTPFAYTVFSGALPTGLSLNSSTGQITGTPSVAGSYSAVIRATDASSGVANTGTIAWTVGAAAATQIVLPLVGAPDLAGLDFAVWSQSRAKDLTAPIVKGNTAAITSASTTLSIVGLGVVQGQVCWVDINNSDGTAAQDPMFAYSGPAVAS